MSGRTMLLCRNICLSNHIIYVGRACGFHALSWVVTFLPLLKLLEVKKKGEKEKEVLIVSTENSVL